jgi:hypothetical protein
MGANQRIYAKGLLLKSKLPGPKRPPNSRIGTVDIVYSLFHAEWIFCPIKGYFAIGLRCSISNAAG